MRSRRNIHLTMSVKPYTLTNIRFSLKEKLSNSKKITIGMTDDERYEVLKGKNIKLTAKTDVEKISQIQNKIGITEQTFNAEKFSDKRKLIIKIGEEFGAFKLYKNESIEISFDYSKNNARESLDKQHKQYYKFIKMLSCFDEIIKNAVGIEVHNRNKENYKTDNTLKNVYVLASAFLDGETVVPVKLEVKEFFDKQNTLYVAIALEDIKKDGVVVQEVAHGVAQQVTRPSSISIADFFKNINPSDESFYKYIPAKFLKEDVSYFLKDNDNRDVIKRESKLLKYIANNTKMKKYSRQEAKNVIADIMSNENYFGKEIVKLQGKTKAEIERLLYNGLNGKDQGERAGVALYIIDNILNKNRQKCRFFLYI